MTGLAPRACAAVTGALLGTAAGILLADGRWWPFAMTVLVGCALAALVRALVPRGERIAVGPALALAFAVHVAAAVLLFTASVALGRRGFIFYDDRTYADIAIRLARYLHGEDVPGFGPPLWDSEAYLFGSYVYLETAIFFVIGSEPIAAILVNTWFALAAAVLVYDMTRRLFTRVAGRIALTLVAFFPSLLLWSSINLKDAFVLAVIGVCLWSLVRFHERPHWGWLATAFGSILLIESVREYIFIGLALLIPLAVAATPRLDIRSRLGWSAPALAVSVVLFAAVQAGIGSGPQLLSLFEFERQQMGVGARTRFVEPPPIVVKEGDTFVVALPLPTGPPPPETARPSPRVVNVAPNTRLIVVEGTPPSAQPEVVYVSPGDVVVVGSGTPAPSPQARVIAGNEVLRPYEEPLDRIVLRTVTYLPTGLAYALFAPFPWAAQTVLELAVIPEMFIWYGLLALAARTAVTQRSRWKSLLPMTAFSVGLLLLFALVEGNVGTLYRHRGMVVPWVIVLAAPAIEALLWSKRMERTHR